LRFFSVRLIGVGIGIRGSLIGIVLRGLFRVGLGLGLRLELVYLFLDDWECLDEGNVWKIIGL
jgi:hypothetical protein